MKIRNGTEKDLDRILLIENCVFRENAWTRELIRSELNGSSDRQTWVIGKDDVIVGYCMVRFGSGEFHLLNMAVDTSHQMKGLGTKLLNHFLNNIHLDSSVFLEVKRGNFPAINLYLEAGFEEIDVRKKYYSDGADAVVMHLKK